MSDRSSRWSDSSLLDPTDDRSRHPERIALAGIVIAFGVAVGFPGLAVGLATVAVWYRAGTPYAIAAGHVLLVAVTPGSIDANSIVIAETAMVGLVLAPIARTDAPARFAVGVVLSVLSLAGLAWVVVRSQPLWIAGAVTAGALAVASYGLYRYTLVSLDLIDDPAATPTEDS